MSTSTPLSSPFQQQFIHTCIQSFNIVPYPWQYLVGEEILRYHSFGSSIKKLLVRPTGGGKTLVFTTVAACLKGITLCIVPLLSLGADQFRKVLLKSERNRSITAFHLDEMSIDQIINLQSIISTMLPTKTFLLYSSPQCLKNKGSAFLQYILLHNLIRFIVVDEIHLVTQYGRSFRSEFATLKDGLFSKVSPTTPMLFMTATCTLPIKSSLEHLFGITINSLHWPFPSGMMHRSVKIDARYHTSQAFSTVTKSIKQFIKPHPNLPSKVIIYSNTRARIETIGEDLCKFLDKDIELCNTDVLVLVGKLKMEQKAKYIDLFVNGSDANDFHLRVLCATSGVGNAGIDSQDVRAVYRVDFPPSIIDVCQEKGRAGRRPSALQQDYSYILLFSLESFLYLFKRIQNPDEEFIDDTFRIQQTSDLLNVAQLLASTACYAITFETALGYPFGDQVSANLTPCNTCPNCTNKRLFPAIHQQGTKQLLFDLFVSGPNRIQGLMTVETVVEGMRKCPNVNMLLFKSSAVLVQG